MSTATNPALFVAGIEKVGLSLSDRNAADPSRISYDAPFSKGNETFVDRNVCKTTLPGGPICKTLL